MMHFEFLQQDEFKKMKGDPENVKVVEIRSN